MRGFKDRADIEDVLAIIAQRVPSPCREMVPLRASFGRVLADTMTSQVAVPPFDRSAMDGYAVRGEDTFGASPYNPLVFEVVGDSMAGSGFAGQVGANQAVRIMTGAPIPKGANAVLMAEHTRATGNQIEITEAIAPGRHVGRYGEDIQAGTVVLAAGRRLRPQDVGVLSSIGVCEVPVFRRPQVAILITGNELLPPGTVPDAAGYKIADSNSVMLEALVQRDGGVPAVSGPIPDDRQRIRDALEQSDADCLLVSGGSSVGAEDHAPTLIAELGELPVHGVAMRPSSPAGVGFLRRETEGASVREAEMPVDRPVFLLPGNPVSCLCAYDFFAGPAIRRMGGLSMDWPYRSSRLPLLRKISSAVGRVDYVRVTLDQGGIVPIATSGASILSSTTRADGFVIVPKDSEGFAAGATVQMFCYE